MNGRKFAYYQIEKNALMLILLPWKMLFSKPEVP